MTKSTNIIFGAPRVPKFFPEEFFIGDFKMQSGWYGVRILQDDWMLLGTEKHFHKEEDCNDSCRKFNKLLNIDDYDYDKLLRDLKNNFKSKFISL